jgi:hypothetical protein
MDLQDLKSAISRLSPEQFAELAAWFAEHEAEQWDRQIEFDQRSGRLECMIKTTRDHIHTGRSKPM